MAAAIGSLPAGAGAPGTACDPRLAELFAPRHAVLGRYEVCSDARPLSDLASPDWAIEALEPLDAFGVASSFDLAAVRRLYGAVRARVAHRWIRQRERFESLTLISPHPNAALNRLEPGTLVIRWICDRRDDDRCKSE